jgi:hypothetical protein
MLADDELLLDGLAEENERALQVAERVGLTNIDLDEAQGQLMLQQTLPRFRAAGAGGQSRRSITHLCWLPAVGQLGFAPR